MIMAPMPRDREKNIWPPAVASTWKMLGGFFDNAVGNSPAGNEHILQAVHSALEGAGTDDADQQSHEQGGHTHGADLLDAAAHAAENDEHGQRHEDQAIDNGLGGVGDEAPTRPQRP